jgi:hypothetical protein
MVFPMVHTDFEKRCVAASTIKTEKPFIEFYRNIVNSIFSLNYGFATCNYDELCDSLPCNHFEIIERSNLLKSGKNNKGQRLHLATFKLDKALTDRATTMLHKA